MSLLRIEDDVGRGAAAAAVPPPDHPAAGRAAAAAARASRGARRRRGPGRAGSRRSCRRGCPPRGRSAPGPGPARRRRHQRERAAEDGSIVVALNASRHNGRHHTRSTHPRSPPETERAGPGEPAPRPLPALATAPTSSRSPCCCRGLGRRRVRRCAAGGRWRSSRWSPSPPGGRNARARRRAGDGRRDVGVRAVDACSRCAWTRRARARRVEGSGRALLYAALVTLPVLTLPFTQLGGQHGAAAGGRDRARSSRSRFVFVLAARRRTGSWPGASTSPSATATAPRRCSRSASGR